MGKTVFAVHAYDISPKRSYFISGRLIIHYKGEIKLTIFK